MLFEVVADGRPVPCAISQQALRDLASGGRRMAPGDAMACFAAARETIEALALRKIRGRRGLPQGILYIWPDDTETEAPS